MNREEMIARVAVIGGGLAGLAAVRAALEAGVPGERICLFDRGDRLFAGWRARVLPDRLRPCSESVWQTLEGPLFEPAWIAAMSSLEAEPDEEEPVLRCAERTLAQLRAVGVKVRLGAKATEVVRDADGRFRVWFEQGVPVATERLIVANGGGRHHAFGWAEEWGLPLRPRHPAGLNLRLTVSRGRSWGRLPDTKAEVSLLKVKGMEGLTETGSCESVHPWVGGDAVCRLTLLQPAVLASARCRGELRFDWLPGQPGGISPKELAQVREQAGRRTLGEHPWPGVSGALWAFVLKSAKIQPETAWRALSMRQGQMLGNQLRDARLRFDGYRLDREAGLSAGGIGLEGLVPGTFEVRSRPGLYWVGEGIDLHALDPSSNAWLASAAGRAAGLAAAGGE